MEGQASELNSLKILARLAGFEPATLGLEVRCSIPLSYRRTIRGYERSFYLESRSSPCKRAGIFAPQSYCSCRTETIREGNPQTLAGAGFHDTKIIMSPQHYL
jgi:hypothetical protein